MPTFNYTFTVNAPLDAVSAFHRDTRALKKLTPPPAFVQLHAIEPLGEGSVSKFTLWFGPLPLGWTAVHSRVSPYGFTDTQTAGPARKWQHTHTFTPLDARTTRIHEHIEYEHAAGLRGWLTRLPFSKPNLTLMFAYRQLVTRWHLRHAAGARLSERSSTLHFTETASGEEKLNFSAAK